MGQIRYGTQDFTACLMDFTSKSTISQVVENKEASRFNNNDFSIGKLTIIQLTETLILYMGSELLQLQKYP